MCIGLMQLIRRITKLIIRLFTIFRLPLDKFTHVLPKWMFLQTFHILLSTQFIFLVVWLISDYSQCIVPSQMSITFTIYQQFSLYQKTNHFQCLSAINVSLDALLLLKWISEVVFSSECFKGFLTLTISSEM